MRASSRYACILTLALAAPSPRAAGAQTVCAPASRALEENSSTVNSPTGNSHTPLERRVTLNALKIPLREALDRIADAAAFRISYAADLLPLSRSVCLEYESAPVRRVLSDILEGVPVKPVVVGDQVVLSPDIPSSAAIQTTPLLKQVGQLDRVIVTGTKTGSSAGSSPIARSVVNGDQILQRGSASLSGSLDGSVAGLWMWEQSPLSLVAKYGSIRGASSFGVSYPKVYVDGIEAANSLIVTHLDPDAVSHIEVIRGPQGAALYGADAISGVMNIVTRHEGASVSRGHVSVQGGASASDYSPSSVLTQRHSATFRYGTTQRSARLGLSASRIGPFIPDAYSQQLTANGAARFVGGRSVFSGTVRVFAQDAQAPSSQVLDRPIDPDSSERQSVRQYTLGGSATFSQGGRWTHSAIAGVDGYRLTSDIGIGGAFPSAIDSALGAASGNAIRGTLRGSSVGHFGDESAVSATVTVGAEYSVVRDETLTGGSAERSSPSFVERRSNGGLVGHVSAGYRNSIFLTGGLRVERNSTLTGIGDLAALPMLGISASRRFGIATVKLRTAYGKGIRPIQTSHAGMLLGWRGSFLASSLSPEEQSGTEIGLDAFIGPDLAIRATRFDQRASGLVQPVGVGASADVSRRARPLVYQLQNVGAITNRGWELQGSLTEGPWSLGATFSEVDSRVRNLAPLYTGDLQPGDRMLQVPARTYGMHASFTHARWQTSWSVTRASDWINYDRLALLDAVELARRDIRQVVGSELRSYWITYEGVTRLGGQVSVSLGRGLTLSLDGENLLDEQRGEPDNATVLPGRTISAGLRIAF